MSENQNATQQKIEDPFSTSSDESDNNKVQNNKRDNQNGNNLLSGISKLSIRELSPRKPLENMYDPSMDISCISNISILEEDNRTSYKDDAVYLSSIYKSIGRLNKKLNSLLKNKFIPKDKIAKILHIAESDDKISLNQEIALLIDKKDVDNMNKELLHEFVAVVFPEACVDMQNNLRDIEEVVEQIILHATNATKQDKQTNEAYAKYINDTKSSIADVVFKVNQIVKEYDICVQSTNISELFVNFVTILKTLDDIMKSQKTEFTQLQNNSNIEEMRKLMSTKKNTIRQLQAENVSFSETITRLDSENIKLKKECVIISNEYKKIAQSIKVKNTIIEKQRNIIDVLQKQINRKQESTITEIKSKMNKLQTKLNNETDLKNRERYVKEYNECKRRIEDFEKFIQR